MDHKDLDAWKASMDLTLKLYEVTRDFPKDELYGLTSQLRRAVISVPSNIAEGAARSSDKEFAQFLYIALGSLAELETQLLIAERLGYLSELTPLQDRILPIKQMVLGLIKYLKGKGPKR